MIRLRMCAFALVPLIMLPSNAAAQARETTFGVKAGVNLSTLSYDDDTLDVTSRWGAVGGAFVARNISDAVGLQLEGLVGQRGAKNSVGRDDYSLRLTYLDVPMTLRIGNTSAGNLHFHAFTGPQLGIKLSAKMRDEGRDMDTDLDDEVKDWDFGWTIGAGAEMNNVSLDARYTWGLTNIDKIDSNADIKNRTFTILLGYRLR